MVATRRKKKELLYSFLQTSSAVKCLNFLGCAPACVCPLCLLRGLGCAVSGGLRQVARLRSDQPRVHVCQSVCASLYGHSKSNVSWMTRLTGRALASCTVCLCVVLDGILCERTARISSGLQ